MNAANAIPTIGERIRHIRKQMHLSQYEFAEQLDIRQPSLSQIEKGVISPSLRLVQTVSQTFGVSYEWLLESTGPQERKAHPNTQAGEHALQPVRIINRSNFAAYLAAEGQAEFLETLPMMFLPDLGGGDLRAFEVDQPLPGFNISEGDLAVCSPVQHPSQVIGGQCYVLVGRSGIRMSRVVSNLYWQQTLLLADPSESTRVERLKITSGNIRELWLISACFTLRLDARLDTRLQDPWAPGQTYMPGFSAQSGSGNLRALPS